MAINISNYIDFILNQRDIDRIIQVLDILLSLTFFGGYFKNDDKK